MAAAVKVSDRGIALISEFEGFAPACYADVGGKQTIGYGHLIKKGETFTTLTESQAMTLLCRDLLFAEACIEESVDVPLTQNQADALASFIYNLGCVAFKGSTLLRKLNAGDYAGAASEFEHWCFCGKNKVDGLLRRRIAERMLFQCAT